MSAGSTDHSRRLANSSPDGAASTLRSTKVSSWSDNKRGKERIMTQTIGKSHGLQDLAQTPLEKPDGPFPILHSDQHAATQKWTDPVELILSTEEAASTPASFEQPNLMWPYRCFFASCTYVTTSANECNKHFEVAHGLIGPKHAKNAEPQTGRIPAQTQEVSNTNEVFDIDFEPSTYPSVLGNSSPARSGTRDDLFIRPSLDSVPQSPVTPARPLAEIFFSQDAPDKISEPTVM